MKLYTNEIFSKIDAFVKENALFDKNTKILVAVSGGPDSMTLLHVFNTYLKEKHSLVIEAAHLNHMLRKEESDRDEEFVIEKCKEWNIPCHTERMDVKAEKPRGDSLENYARVVRYNFLHKIKNEIKADRIATGHTKSDQQETVIMRLYQGSGIHGLRGILPRRDDNIIRPLLCVEREDIEEYIKTNSIPYRTDSSNREKKYLRNKIRLELLPEIKKGNPDFAKKLEQMAESASKELKSIEKDVKKEAQRVISVTDKGYFLLDLNKPLIYSNFVLREFYMKLLERPERKHINALEGLISKPCGKSIKLPKGFTAWKIKNGILAGKFAKNNKNISYNCVLGEKIFLESFGVYAESILKEGKPEEYPHESEYKTVFDKESIGNKWQFRLWKKGDFLNPLGLKGRKKVSDLLRERNVLACERENIIVMDTPKGIAWIVGHRISEDFKIRENTRNHICVFLVK